MKEEAMCLIFKWVQRPKLTVAIVFINIGLSTLLADLNHGLVAHWRFDGTTSDEILGTAFDNADKINYVFDRFGSQNSAANLTNIIHSATQAATSGQIPKENQERTISFWCKFSAPTYLPIIGQGNMGLMSLPATNPVEPVFRIITRPSNTWSFEFNDNKGFFINNDFYNNEWHFICLTYNGSKLSVFINDEVFDPTLTSYGNITLPLETGNNDFFLRGSSEVDYFLDDLRFYSRALQVDEVAALYEELYFKITDQPKSANVDIGANLVLGVKVAGIEGHSYQWFKDNIPVPNVRGSTYPIFGVKHSDMGNYHVEITHNGHSLESETATILVKGPPSIISQPKGGEFEITETIRLKVEAIGYPPVAYQWKFNGDSIINANEPSLEIPNASNVYEGQYSVEVINEFGAIDSAEIEITVVFKDNDGDGLGNIEEGRIGTDIHNPDTDYDGINDYEEINRYKTNPVSQDSDLDSWDDLVELEFQSDPNEKQSTPSEGLVLQQELFSSSFEFPTINEAIKSGNKGSVDAWAGDIDFSEWIEQGDFGVRKEAVTHGDQNLFYNDPSNAVLSTRLRNTVAPGDIIVVSMNYRIFKHRNRWLDFIMDYQVVEKRINHSRPYWKPYRLWKVTHSADEETFMTRLQKLDIYFKIPATIENNDLMLRIKLDSQGWDNLSWQGQHAGIDIDSVRINKVILDKTQDSDGDLLSDFQELIYGTNPNNPDTDNDGLADGYEIGYGRFFVIPESKTYLAAQRAAQLKNAHLATFTTLIEWESFVNQGYLNTVLQNTYWLGGKVEGLNRVNWDTSESGNFSLWHPGQPDNNDEASNLGLKIRGTEQGWHDIPSDSQIPALAEYGYPSDPTLSDTDGDGWNDKIESNYQTDPNNPSVHPSHADLPLAIIIERDGFDIAIKFFGKSSIEYQIQGSDDLVEWALVGIPVTGEGNWIILEQDKLHKMHFWRVFQMP